MTPTTRDAFVRSLWARLEGSTPDDVTVTTRLVDPEAPVDDLPRPGGRRVSVLVVAGLGVATAFPDYVHLYAAAAATAQRLLDALGHRDPCRAAELRTCLRDAVEACGREVAPYLYPSEAPEGAEKAA